MSDPGDIARNQLARLLLGAGQRQRLNLTGTMTSGAGTDEETAVTGLPDFTEAGKVLMLVVESGDLQASWEYPTGGTGTGRYRQFVIELDGSGGFDFVVDVDGSPVLSLESLE